ncbi:head completion/stabilization protein [Acidovorax sp. SUPP2825]|uniref:head completion/stabilization protein n=1 Tax=Acidovorax sp. SUPP2825 TaxID=2920879 RepID=UPI0023DE1B4B|nr:head completion/stabilization protein [Acidovorax sp. SUPP2825]GKS93244.1 head completion/stabilization protein [Acidovorax sp. SUPP2825]
MSFVATANPPARGAEPAVANDGFFPNIDREKLRNDIRLDGTVTPERLRKALLTAMWSVNGELREWKAAQIKAGYTTLQAVPSEQLDGESVRIEQYRTAICAHVQAQLAEAYRDMDTLPQGAGKEGRVQAAVELRIDGFNQQQRWAIADLQESSRVIAELL